MKYLFLLILSVGVGLSANAQKSGKKKTTPTKSKATVVPPAPTTTPSAGVASPPSPPSSDTIPTVTVKKSLRLDAAILDTTFKKNSPKVDSFVLPYEDLRADDAIYRHRIWREIDTREKMNQIFGYPADEDNGNQRFISIIYDALKDSTTGLTAFSSSDDRFTTPLTRSEVAQTLLGDEIEVTVYGPDGKPSGKKKTRNEINLDSSIYKYHIKEEVIFDKESSKLFWRIIGIAPVKRGKSASTGLDLGDTEIFWIYFPDLKPILTKYFAYNPKNYGARISWAAIFDNRIFSGRIIKSTLNNPKDKFISEIGGLKDDKLLQLYEGENIKEKIFNYEQDQWSY